MSKLQNSVITFSPNNVQKTHYLFMWSSTISDISKNWRHDLASRWNCLRLLWSSFFPFSPLFRLFFRLLCEVIHPWLWIDALLYQKHRQTRVKTSPRRCFCSTVCKRCTHLAHSFLISKFSFNMWRRTLFKMPSKYAFNWRSFNTILWIFFTISGVVTSFGRPLFVSAPRLNCHPTFYCCKRRSRLP